MMIATPLLAAVLILSPPVLPPPPAQEPTPTISAEKTPDELTRDASIPREIRNYVKAAQREREAKLTQVRNTVNLLNDRIPRLRSGKIVPRDSSDSVAEEGGVINGVVVRHRGYSRSGVQEIIENGKLRFEFDSLEIKTKAVRETRTELEIAQRLVRLLSDVTMLMHPPLTINSQSKIGDSGVHADDDYGRAIAEQVVDGLNVIVRFEYLRQLTAGYWDWEESIVVWISDIDTSEMRDGGAIDLGDHVLLADQMRTYETAIGGSNTVLNFTALPLEQYVPRKWFVPAEWRR